MGASERAMEDDNAVLGSGAARKTIWEVSLELFVLLVPFFHPRDHRACWGGGGGLGEGCLGQK